MALRLNNVRIVLARPIYGGNLGAVCRAMKNMDLSDLCLVTPSPDLDFSEAQKYALHAIDILESRRQFDSVAAAVADCALVAGTTARPGLYRGHSLTPREWAPRLLEAAQDAPVAVVFGPENDGLSNEELTLCTQLIRIPSSPRYESLNLAQAVMVCAYELYQASGNYAAPQERYPEASSQMRERMFTMWRETMYAIGFFDDLKADHMMMAFRRIFSRGKLTEADANILMGVARQAQWVAKHGPHQPPPACP